MSRKTAREVLMKLLYEKEIAGEYNEESLQSLVKEFSLKVPDDAYIQQIIKGMVEEQDKIDSYISQYAEGWSIDRISRVDLSILRLALYEILYRQDIPTGVSINEAVELAKMYSGEKSSSFINGILGSFIRTEVIEKDEE